MDLIIVADTRAIADADEGEDDTVITYLHIVLDINEGEYLTVIADLCLWRYLGLWRNFTCHILLILIIYFRRREPDRD